EGGQTQPVPPTPYDQLPSPSVPAYPQPHSYGWTSPHGVPPSYGGPPTDVGGRGRGAGRGRGWRMALALLVTAVLAGGIGGAIVAATQGHAGAQVPAGGPAASAAAVPATGTTSQVRAALAKIAPSVVDITTAGGGEGGFFGGGGSGGAGTGIITGAAGEVVTNAHVVAGASSVRVHVPGHSGTVTATVVGSDSSVDLAVLHLQGLSGLPTATFAATSTVHVGDQVLAVGNAEGYGGAPTVTEGIISALNRDLPAGEGAAALRGLLQTDAAINPGSSGGALVDTAGRVVGITNAIAAGSRGQPAQNIGFAIPTDTVLKVLPALRAGRNVTGGGNASGTPTAFLGVDLSDAGQGAGALVAAVEPGTPAAAAGLQPGDMITAADGTTISSPADLRSVVARHKPGNKIKLTWRPSGQSQTRSATVTLATRLANAG
ncbi:MAG TPA: trypsin-like peptidase domain-containing protein, partial [Actinomycetes bacterium]|nr:trypsin-like peptidase domain-containing protein [Actinomycetes bacterium]